MKVFQLWKIFIFNFRIADKRRWSGGITRYWVGLLAMVRSLRWFITFARKGGKSKYIIHYFKVWHLIIFFMNAAISRWYTVLSRKSVKMTKNWQSVIQVYFQSFAMVFLIFEISSQMDLQISAFNITDVCFAQFWIFYDFSRCCWLNFIKDQYGIVGMWGHTEGLSLNWTYPPQVDVGGVIDFINIISCLIFFSSTVSISSISVRWTWTKCAEKNNL